MNPVVFVGPSLYGTSCAEMSDIIVRPPAVCGDIMRAVLEGVRVIGLIDGGFEQGPSVWHKEILEAIRAGCTVYGASSMGALRAAELHGHGMIGVGQVFEDYSSGRRASDGDVAITHGPAELGYPPLSLALVDLEDVVDRLSAESAIVDDDAEELLKAGRAMHFKDRSWSAVLSSATRSAHRRETLQLEIDASGPAVKTRDALALLGAIGSKPPKPEPIHYTRTIFMSKLINTIEASL